MGRHGGGSRCGGISGGGGSSSRTSRTPFNGCYNRSYVGMFGKRHAYYTSDSSVGTKSGLDFWTILVIIIVTIHMVFMISKFGFLGLLGMGGKVEGDESRIFIQDRSNLLNTQEEYEVLGLFEKVYEKTGMPITLYTENFDWKDHYNNIEVYSEELYYKLGMEEDAMVILFTSEDKNGFWDWEYDMYCGDKTIRCLSNATFDELITNFQKAMAKEDLVYALDYSWNSIMNDIGEHSFRFHSICDTLPMLCLYVLFYVGILWIALQTNSIYRYFKKNPDKLSMEKMVFYNKCPNCGVTNSFQSETCPYCNSLLLIENESNS